MPVSGLGGEANKGQETSIIGSQYVQSQLVDLLKNTKQEDSEKTVQEQKLQEKREMEKLLEEKNQSQIGTRIIANLAKKIAHTNAAFSAARLSKDTMESLKKDYDQIFGGKASSSEDAADIRNLSSRVGKAKHGKGDQNQEGFSGNGRGGQQNSSKDDLLKQYLSLYTQALAGGGKDIKDKIAQIEKELIMKGMSLKELQEIQTGVANKMRQQISYQIKEAYLKRLFTDSKSLERVINNKAVDNILDFAMQSYQLGGADFGSFMGSLQGATNEMIKEAKAETLDFAKEELENMSIRSALGNEKDAKPEDIEKLLKIAQKAGLKLNQFVKDLNQKKSDLGLNYFEAPRRDSMLMLPEPHPFEAFADMMSQQDQQEKEGKQRQYEFTKEDEKEVLINKLRAIYMNRAMKGNSIGSILETGFKVVKLKNGLIKLGIKSEEFVELEKQGTKMGTYFLMKMLREAFEERATLYELKGAAFELVQRKVKGVLRNLERLGVTISQYDLDRLRDKCDHEMREQALSELEAITCLLKSHKFAQLEGKQKQLVKLINRLNEEAHLTMEEASEEALKLIHAEKQSLHRVKEAA